MALRKDIAETALPAAVLARLVLGQHVGPQSLRLDLARHEQQEYHKR